MVCSCLQSWFLVFLHFIIRINVEITSIWKTYKFQMFHSSLWSSQTLKQPLSYWWLCGEEGWNVGCWLHLCYCLMWLHSAVNEFICASHHLAMIVICGSSHLKVFNSSVVRASSEITEGHALKSHLELRFFSKLMSFLHFKLINIKYLLRNSQKFPARLSALANVSADLMGHYMYMLYHLNQSL